MDSIPLPALNIRPPENPLDQYAKALSVKSMMQGQQVQQAQLTGVQQENQLRAQQMADQQAMTKSMSEWDGEDISKLPAIVLKNGGSANAVFNVQKQLLDRRASLSKIALDDAATGEKKLETIKGQHDQIAGGLESLVDPASVKDEDLHQEANRTINGFVSDGVMDVAHAKDLQTKIDATSDPAALRTLIDHYAKVHMGGQQLVEDAIKERDAATKEWKEVPGTGMFFNTRTQQVRTPEGAVQSPQMMEGRYVALQANKAKGIKLSDDDKAFISGWEKMKNESKQFAFNLEAGGVQSLTPLTPKQAATRDAILEGRMTIPGSFALKTPYWQNVMGGVLEEDPQWSEQRAQLRKSFTQDKEIGAINTALGHVGVLNDAIDALNNGDVKALNSLANRVGVQFGKDNVTTFNTIVHRVGPEVAKAYIGAGGSAGERGADEKDFDPSLGPTQLRSNVAETVKLLQSKISSKAFQWDQNKSDSMPDFKTRFIMPEAQATIDKLAPKAPTNRVTTPARPKNVPANATWNTQSRTWSIP